MGLLKQLGLGAPKAAIGIPQAPPPADLPAGSPLRSPQAQAGTQEAELEEILIDPAHADITPGTPFPLHATFEFADGTSRNATALVKWTSSDPAIQIDERGVATARPVTASAVITATDPRTGKSATASAAVAAPKEGPALLKIEVKPAAVSLVGSAYLGQDAKPQQFEAIGTFADGSTRNLTARVDWSSSVAEVVSVERSGGKATPGHRAGTALVTATDRTSAALGVAIAGSAKVTVTVPVVKTIEILPAVPRMAAGEKRTFSASRVYSDGSKVPLGAAVTWSATDKVFIDEKGAARTTGIGPATITALDKGSGMRGELQLTIEGERAKETPFGRFAYVADQESVVLPLLNKAIKAFGDAEALDEQLDALDLRLTDAADKIPPVADVVADVQKRTDRTTRLEANAARASDKDLELLVAMLEKLQEDARVAEANLGITRDDLKGAQDMARAESLMKEAQKHQKGLQNFVRAVSIGTDLAFKASKGDPSVIKPAWDAAGFVVGIFADDVNPWLKEAQALQSQAKTLLLDNAATKLALATTHGKALEKQMKKLEPKLKEFQEDDARNWKNVEGSFDAPKGGIFKFEDVKAALALAQQEIGLARKAAETAYGAREAARALVRPSVPPSEWMAQPKEGQKVIMAMIQGATAMFDGCIAKRQRGDALLKRFQDTHAAARKAMYTA